MSGGSMYYLYRKVEDAEFEQDTPERKRFAEHLQKVAKALHDIEWVDSCDYGLGDEDEAIRACVGNDVQDLVAVLREVLNLLGPDAPECCGCRYEWQKAIDLIKDCLK